MATRVYTREVERTAVGTRLVLTSRHYGLGTGTPPYSTMTTSLELMEPPSIERSWNLGTARRTHAAAIAALLTDDTPAE